MRRHLANLEAYLAGALLAAVTVLIVAQLVLSRAAPRLSSPLTTLVLALFFWATMLGIPAATRQGAHVSVNLLTRRAPERWQGALLAFLLAATLAFFLALAVTGVRLCYAQAVVQHNRFVGASWPAWVVTASIPLAAALSCLRAVEARWEARRRKSVEREV